jgi:UDP-N-acetylglucosamine 3-dehydrogenase
MNLRIGILSVAHIHAENYAVILKDFPGVDLVGFSDEDPETGRRFAEQYELPWFSKHQDLLAERLDGVLICSENGRHRDLVENAATAQCQILCEKPIEIDLGPAESMQAVCERHQVRFMTAFPMRFAQSTRAVRTMIRNGDLGNILGVNGINHSEIPAGHRTWFADKELAGGGAVMDHTVHLADLLRWFFAAEVAEVYAEIGNPFRPKDLKVDTAGLILLTLTNGVKASIDCSWSRPTSYPRWGHLKMEIVGEKGVVAMDSFAEYLTVYSQDSSRNPCWTGYGPDPNRAMLEEFVASIREERDPSVTWKDGYEALRVALAAYRSGDEQQPVTLRE